MAKLTKREREAVAEKRLHSILARHGVANSRTLEQKISDAGPFNQRIDPHILTPVRNRLVKAGNLVKFHNGTNWYHLPDTPDDYVQERLAAQLPIYQSLNQGTVSLRLGQSLEIATYRSLQAANDAEFYGRFTNLDAHDDSTLYVKEEPPNYVGNRSISGKRNLDFLIRHADAGYLGIECKNIREWLYPNRSEIIETLGKCVELDCVPVIIARRVPFVTFKVLIKCGVIIYQHYNQILPDADFSLADQARDKTLLGYHDIRLGNQPDERLLKFITTNLPAVAAEARERFDIFSDLLAHFGSGEMPYAEFVARARRRSLGVNEDHDWQEEPEPEDDTFG